MHSDDSHPRVTIAIPTKDDEATIESCLRGALAQDYSADAIDIVVADAMSMDATREIVLRIAAEADSGGRVRLIDNPRRTRAAPAPCHGPGPRRTSDAPVESGAVDRRQAAPRIRAAGERVPPGDHPRPRRAERPRGGDERGDDRDSVMKRS